MLANCRNAVFLLTGNLGKRIICELSILAETNELAGGEENEGCFTVSSLNY